MGVQSHIKSLSKSSFTCMCGAKLSARYHSCSGCSAGDTGFAFYFIFFFPVVINVLRLNDTSQINENN